MATPQDPQEKICTQCQLSKPLDDFRNDKHRPDGKSSKCRLCMRIRDAELNLENPEPRRKRTAKWRANNPDKVTVYTEAHREEKNAQRRERYAEDPEAELIVNRATYMLRKDVWQPTRAKWERNNRHKRNAQTAARRLDNPEPFRARDKRWADANPEKIHAKNATFYANHAEEECARAAAYKLEHPEWWQEYQTDYRSTHKDEARASAALLRAKHPERHRARIKRRKARIKNAPKNDLTDAQWEEILIAFDYRCVYCPDDCKDCRYKRHELTQEHVTPYAHNGSNTLWNVVPACQSHNSKKGTKGVLKPVQMLLLTIAPPKPYNPKKKGA